MRITDFVPRKLREDLRDFKEQRDREPDERQRLIVLLAIRDAFFAVLFAIAIFVIIRDWLGFGLSNFQLSLLPISFVCIGGLTIGVSLASRRIDMSRRGAFYRAIVLFLGIPSGLLAILALSWAEIISTPEGGWVPGFVRITVITAIGIGLWMMVFSRNRHH